MPNGFSRLGTPTRSGVPSNRGLGDGKGYIFIEWAAALKPPAAKKTQITERRNFIFALQAVPPAAPAVPALPALRALLCPPAGR